MSAWGVGPFQSDGACDWIASKVTDVIAATIEQSLREFLKHPVRRIRVHMLDPNKKSEYDKWCAEKKSRRLTGRALQEWSRKWASVQKTMMMNGRVSDHDRAEAAAGLLDRFTPYARAYTRFVTLDKKHRHGLFGMMRVKGKHPNARHEASHSPADPIHLAYNAENGRLYTLATKAVQALLDDEAWLSSWSSMEMKRKSLDGLLKSLEAKRQNERPHVLVGLRMKACRWNRQRWYVNPKRLRMKVEPRKKAST